MNQVNLLKNNANYVLEKQSKDISLSLRCYPRKPKDGKINWNENSEQILRLINACNKPYYGAYCTFEGEEIKIWDATLIKSQEPHLAIPGQISKINSEDGCIEVICGKGILKISLIELREKEIKPSEIIKSIRKRLE